MQIAPFSVPSLQLLCLKKKSSLMKFYLRLNELIITHLRKQQWKMTLSLSGIVPAGSWSVETRMRGYMLLAQSLIGAILGPGGCHRAQLESLSSATPTSLSVTRDDGAEGGGTKWLETPLTLQTTVGKTSALRAEFLNATPLKRHIWSIRQFLF